MANQLWQELADIIANIAPLSGASLTDQEITLTNGLFTITENQFAAPIDLGTRLFAHPSPLPNSILNPQLIRKYIDSFRIPNQGLQLNHIGVCYRVDSFNTEKQNLLSELTNTTYQLYEEPSMGPDKWWYIATNQIELPMLELIPIERTNDPWTDLWLPHIQIDIDTHTKAEIIEQRANAIFRGNPTPFHCVVVDSTIHVVRLRVGIISGVNIVIDLGTNKRHSAYRHKYLFKQLT